MLYEFLPYILTILSIIFIFYKFDIFGEIPLNNTTNVIYNINKIKQLVGYRLIIIICLFALPIINFSNNDIKTYTYGSKLLENLVQLLIIIILDLILFRIVTHQTHEMHQTLQTYQTHQTLQRHQTY